jgi:Zn-finger nucleic acid-binding protein
MVMACPRDGAALVPTRDVLGAGTQGQVCPTCAGAMVEWKAAQPFLVKAGLTLDSLQVLVTRGTPGKTASVTCTACGKGPMKAFVFQGVELDVCEQCGSLWFDRGELARLSKGTLGTAAPPPRPKVAGEREESVGVFEMWWDCGYCGTVGLLGASNRFCPGCGAQQDASRRYFPPQGQEAAANVSFDGVDRTCPACQTPNGAKANNCRSCGSPLDGSTGVATVADRASGAPTGRPAPSPSKAGTRWWLWGLAALAVFGCVTCGVALSWKKDVSVTVTSHTWSRDIDVERLTAVPDSAWCDSMPSGAYAVSRSRQQRSTKQLPDGETCTTRDVDRGNGTFERKKECRPKYRDEPVYDEKCSFTVDRWQKDRSLSNSGRGTSPSPSWPEVRLGRTCSSLGCEREGAHHETYSLQLAGADGKSYSCSLSASRWNSVADGVKKPIKIAVLTGIADCDAL